MSAVILSFLTVQQTGSLILQHLKKIFKGIWCFCLSHFEKNAGPKQPVSWLHFPEIKTKVHLLRTAFMHHLHLNISLSLCSSLHPRQQLLLSEQSSDRAFFLFRGSVSFPLLPSAPSHDCRGFPSNIVGIFSPWQSVVIGVVIYDINKTQYQPKTERERRMDKTLTWPADCVSEHWCIFPEWAATCWCFLLLSDALLCCESSHNAQSQPGHTDTTWRHKQHRAYFVLHLDKANKVVYASSHSSIYTCAQWACVALEFLLGFCRPVDSFYASLLQKTVSYVVTTNALEEMTVLTRSYIFRKVHISLRLTLPRRICCYNIHMI